MGSDLFEDNELPVHLVTLDAFWIDKFEVTNAMYALCVKAGKCSAPSQKSLGKNPSYYGNSKFDNYPVIYVSWDNANVYCKWANRQLPTEAQWEKAARGIDRRIYPWGDVAPDKSKLNYNYNVGDTNTTEVGKYLSGASAYGAMDMAGNVWEWVNDWFDRYRISPSPNPTGPTSGKERVLRGGSWKDEDINLVRASFRNFSVPSNADENIGFRCASSP